MFTNQFRVPRMSCQGCVRKITNKLTSVEGVSKVEVTLADKTVTVEHGEQVSPSILIAALDQAGYREVVHLN